MSALCAKKLSEQYFRRDEGQVYLVVVDHGEEYNILKDQSPPLSDAGDRANLWEQRAYASRKLTYTPEPISDSNGTYVAAYIPIVRGAEVLGLVAAEYDSGTLSDLRSIVFSAFWKSIIPGIVLSLLVAGVLALRFVEPEDVLRSTAESAREEKTRALKGAADEPWNSLTDRELEVAELAGDALTIKAMAEKLVVGTETIKTHLKNIKDKTGWSKVELGFKVQARRLASAPDVTG
ncbi:MAG: LuxR C-terminal-related transcriptional regulator [Candidatus Cybelea sp.]